MTEQEREDLTRIHALAQQIASLEAKVAELQAEKDEFQKERILHRSHWQFKMSLLEAIGFPYEVDDSNALGRIRQALEAKDAAIAEQAKEIERLRTLCARVVAETDSPDYGGGISMMLDAELKTALGGSNDAGR